MWTYAVCAGACRRPGRGRLVTGRSDGAPSRGREKTLEECLAVRNRPELGEDLARHGAEQQGPGGQSLGQVDGVQPCRGEHRCLEQCADTGLGARRHEAEPPRVGEPVRCPDVVEQGDEQDEDGRARLLGALGRGLVVRDRRAVDEREVVRPVGRPRAQGAADGVPSCLEVVVGDGVVGAADGSGE